MASLFYTENMTPSKHKRDSCRNDGCLNRLRLPLASWGNRSLGIRYWRYDGLPQYHVSPYHTGGQYVHRHSSHQILKSTSLMTADQDRVENMTADDLVLRVEYGSGDPNSSPRRNAPQICTLDDRTQDVAVKSASINI